MTLNLLICLLLYFILTDYLSTKVVTLFIEILYQIFLILQNIVSYSCYVITVYIYI